MKGDQNNAKFAESFTLITLFIVISVIRSIFDSLYQIKRMMRSHLTNLFGIARRCNVSYGCKSMILVSLKYWC